MSLPEGFETAADSKAAYDLLAGRIQRQKNYALPQAFYDCEDGNRCNLACCPVCTRKFRKRLLSASRQARLADCTWTRVSVIPRNVSFAIGELNTADLNQLKRRMMRALQRASKRLGGVVMIGGFDVSCNVSDNVDPYWQLHAYVLINAPDTEALRRVLASSIKGDPNVRCSHDFKEVEPGAFEDALTYSLKNGFNRRSSYDEPERLKKDGTPRRNTRPLSLTAAQSVELAAWLGHYSVDSRFLMVGMHRSASPSSSFRFASTNLRFNHG